MKSRIIVQFTFFASTQLACSQTGGQVRNLRSTQSHVKLESPQSTRPRRLDTIRDDDICLYNGTYLDKCRTCDPDVELPKYVKHYVYTRQDHPPEYRPEDQAIEHQAENKEETDKATKDASKSLKDDSSSIDGWEKRYGDAEFLQCIPQCPEGYKLCTNRRPRADGETYSDGLAKYYIDYRMVRCIEDDWNCGLCTPGRFCRSEMRCIEIGSKYDCVDEEGNDAWW